MSQPPKANRPGRLGGLSEITIGWLEQTEAARRKARGQYMTPRPVAAALIDRLELRPGLRVLDPGVGTGELLRAALDREPELEVTGWDIDQEVLETAGRLVPEARLERRSALDAEPGRGFDLVIGNPPYFQLRLDQGERERFGAVISGRPNIFALFFPAGLQQLRPGGRLAYIVPPSMNSGAYFEALREYISDRAEIRDLTILERNDLFEGANTAIQLLTLQSNEANPPVGRIIRSPAENPTHRGFVFEREVPEAGFRRVIFSPDPDRLAAEFEGRRTLWELGLEAATGQVVWNQNRDRLHETPGPGRVPLVWSHSIGGGELEAGPGGFGPVRPGKPGFYETSAGGRPPLRGPAVTVNRVVGAVGRGELRAALIPAGVEFLAENHVNVVRPRQPDTRGGSENPHRGRKSDRLQAGGPVWVDWPALLAALLQPGVASRVRRLTGNTQISARELTHLLPLDCRKFDVAATGNHT